MKPKIYIDGKEGTTGLQIYERLGGRDDIELLLIDEDKRKDIEERRSSSMQPTLRFCACRMRRHARPFRSSRTTRPALLTHRPRTAPTRIGTTALPSFPRRTAKPSRTLSVWLIRAATRADLFPRFTRW